MHFLAPILLSGLALASVPLIIHLLNRRRFQVVDWAPMRYLKLTLKNNRRRLRLEQWLLLLIRTLVVAVLILAVARPTLTTASLAGLLGGRTRTSQLLVIDDSLSMGYELEQRSAFAQAKDAAADLIAALPSQDNLTVMLTSAPDAPLVREVHPREATGLAETIRRLELTHTGNNWGATFRTADSLLATATFPARQVTLITDLRRAGWSAEVTEVTRLWNEHAVGLRIIDVGSRRTENVSLLAFRQEDPPLVLPNTPVNLRAVIRNANPRPVPAGQATLTVGEQSHPVMLPELPAGQTIEVPLSISLPNAGQYPVRLALPEDPLPQDNARWLSIDCRPRLDVVMLDGAPSAQAFESSSDFLAVAFTVGSDAWHVRKITDPDMLAAVASAAGGPAGSIDRGAPATRPAAGEASTPATGPASPTPAAAISAFSGTGAASAAGADILVLTNVATLKPAQVRVLEKLVDAGAGLMIFMGDQVDVAAYNQRLFNDGKGLLPVRLEGAVDESVKGLVIESLDRSPLEPLRGLAPEALARIQASRLMAVAPVAADAVTGAGAHAATQAAATAARVLARWNDTLGRPAVIEKRFGRGRVLLWTTSADRRWTDWPIDPTFVLATRSAAMSAARGGSQTDAMIVGQKIELSFPPGTTPLEPRIFAPGMEAPQALVAGRTPTGEATLSYDRTAVAGAYRVSWHDALGNADVRYFALNPDAAESDLTPIDEPELRRLVAPLPLAIDRPNEASAAGHPREPELWRTFVMALLALMVFETILAVWVGRER